uniref:Nanos-type domain-containing protein n=1 Tax=Syphacia muris TaxID=451379 RepID=A0A0N5AR45_9BILA
MELTRSDRLQDRTAEFVGVGKLRGFLDSPVNLKNMLGMELSRQTLEEIILKNSEDMVRRLIDDNPLPYSAPPDLPSQPFFFGDVPIKPSSSQSSRSSSSSINTFPITGGKGYKHSRDLSRRCDTKAVFVSDANSKVETRKPSMSPYQQRQNNHFQEIKSCGACNYCRATHNPYEDHTKFNCPALASLAPCRLCKASGPFNHTITYCPMKQKVILKKKSFAYP